MKNQALDKLIDDLKARLERQERALAQTKAALAAVEQATK